MTVIINIRGQDLKSFAQVFITTRVTLVLKDWKDSSKDFYLTGCPLYATNQRFFIKRPTGEEYYAQWKDIREIWVHSPLKRHFEEARARRRK